MPERTNNDPGTSLPSARVELKFRGFPELRSNVLYCPKQFFTVVVPYSSVNCIRLVAYMLRQTLGWVDEDGQPLKERHDFSYREFETQAGIVQSALQKAVDEALKFHFIRKAQKARIQSQGAAAKSAAYELLWDESRYTDDVEEFRGFYLQPAYLDESGQTRIGRKNIPNIFFDYLVKEENRALIRVVGTLLWYSIDWGKGGERKVTVRKSLRELVALTQLAKGSVVRALDEAVDKGYIERVEPGVFDFAGNQHGSITVYGINWTSEYTYTYEGLAVSRSEEAERFKNETRPLLSNASKMRHGAEGGTLQKRDTAKASERFKNETRNASKTRPAERFKNETIRTTNSTIPNISIPNNSNSGGVPSPARVVAAGTAVERLIQEGFSKQAATALASKVSEEVILQQIELLPYRNAQKNRLGLLRRAIEENWAAPEVKTKDVFSSPGSVFAAHFYAGYHGNADSPVSEPSAKEAAACDEFVQRLLSVQNASGQVAVWGRQFGELVRHRHEEKRQLFPALVPALRQFGDEFFTRLKAVVQSQREGKLRDARERHVSRFRADYQDYLRAAYERHEAEGSPLFRELLSDEEDSLRSVRNNKFGLDTQALLQRYQSKESRLERFESLIGYTPVEHDVLSFWSWDQKLNPEPFNEESL